MVKSGWQLCGSNYCIMHIVDTVSVKTTIMFQVRLNRSLLFIVVLFLWSRAKTALSKTPHKTTKINRDGDQIFYCLNLHKINWQLYLSKLTRLLIENTTFIKHNKVLVEYYWIRSLIMFSIMTKTWLETKSITVWNVLNPGC